MTPEQRALLEFYAVSLARDDAWPDASAAIRAALAEVDALRAELAKMGKALGQ